MRPPAPPPSPRPRPPRPSRPLWPTEGSATEWHPRPSLPQPPRRPWGNLTAELGRFRGTVQDLERHLRAHGYPLRANQTYTSVARHIYEFLRRHQRAGAPASKPHQPHPTASPTQSTGKWDSNQGDVDPASDGAHLVTTARHPKPEVLGSAVDGALIVSLDGLRGQFERVVLRWRPLPPAEGPSGELTVDGSERTVRLPNLRPGTTYHVEVHGVRAGQTSKSYAFITTTGSVGWGPGLPPPPVQHHLPSRAPLTPPTVSPLRPPPPLTAPFLLLACLAQAAGHYHRKLPSSVPKATPMPGSWHSPEGGVPWLTPGLPSSLAMPLLPGKSNILT